jgi:hypothetical protein
MGSDLRVVVNEISPLPRLARARGSLQSESENLATCGLGKVTENLDLTGLLERSKIVPAPRDQVTRCNPGSRIDGNERFDRLAAARRRVAEWETELAIAKRSTELLKSVAAGKAVRSD